MHALHMLIRKFMAHVHLKRKRLETVFVTLEYAIRLLLKLNLKRSLLNWQSHIHSEVERNTLKNQYDK